MEMEMNHRQRTYLSRVRGNMGVRLSLGREQGGAAAAWTDKGHLPVPFPGSRPSRPDCPLG